MTRLFRSRTTDDCRTSTFVVFDAGIRDMAGYLDFMMAVYLRCSS